MIHLKRFVFNPISTCCYVVWDEERTGCAVVDPGMWRPAEREELFGYLDPGAPEYEAIRKEVWACKLDRANIRENAEKYLLDIGVPQAHIDAFREIMLEK